jgi:FtsH-binding integral membrane protein
VRISLRRRSLKGVITGFGVSIFLTAIGAILAFAVQKHVNGISVQTIGWILMIVGIVGGVISMVFWQSWQGPATSRAVARSWTSRQRPANCSNLQNATVSIPVKRPAPHGSQTIPTQRRKGGTMSIWLLILIVVLVVMALGGFGYSRR